MGDDARRIAAELHDGAMQEITLARLQLDLLGASIGKDPAVADELAALSDLLQEASLRLQTLTHMLAPRIHIV